MPHNNANALSARPEVLTRPKLEGGRRFVLQTPFQAAGDQPTAIAELTEGVLAGERNQVLLGATGTGKTFTMAKVIEETQRPAIILAPEQDARRAALRRVQGLLPRQRRRVLRQLLRLLPARSLCRPRTDTYIEKESQINEQIDRMRHSATRALLERDDVIIVASVSCIYGIGSVETYSAMTQDLVVGQTLRPAPGDRRTGGPAVPPQRPGLPARRLPRARRQPRSLARPPRRPRLALFLLRRGAGGDHRIRPADRRQDRQFQADPHLRQQPLRHAAPDDAAGDPGHQARAAPAPRPACERRQTAGGAAAGTARAISISRCSRRPASATGSRTTRAI